MLLVLLALLAPATTAEQCYEKTRIVIAKCSSGGGGNGTTAKAAAAAAYFSQIDRPVACNASLYTQHAEVYDLTVEPLSERRWRLESRRWSDDAQKGKKGGAENKSCSLTRGLLGRLNPKEGEQSGFRTPAGERIALENFVSRPPHDVYEIERNSTALLDLFRAAAIETPAGHIFTLSKFAATIERKIAKCRAASKSSVFPSNTTAPPPPPPARPGFPVGLVAGCGVVALLLLIAIIIIIYLFVCKPQSKKKKGANVKRKPLSTSGGSSSSTKALKTHSLDRNSAVKETWEDRLRREDEQVHSDRTATNVSSRPSESRKKSPPTTKTISERSTKSVVTVTEGTSAKTVKDDDTTEKKTTTVE